MNWKLVRVTRTGFQFIFHPAGNWSDTKRIRVVLKARNSV